VGFLVGGKNNGFLPQRRLGIELNLFKNIFIVKNRDK